jgi:DNA replication protein
MYGIMNKENKKLVVESLFIKEAFKRNLSLSEFLVLLYFDNSFDSIFDVANVSKTLMMSEEEVLNAFSSLLEKNLIKVDATPNQFGKVIEKINLDNYYYGINSSDLKKDSKKTSSKEDIFSTFESKLGRTLSQMDYEIIKAWLENGSSEELVLEALDEALNNGVASLRYIDKIVYEWKKKGYKTVDDVKNHSKKNGEGTVLGKDVLDYNWLDEDE